MLCRITLAVAAVLWCTILPDILAALLCGLVQLQAMELGNPVGVVLDVICKLHQVEQVILCVSFAFSGLRLCIFDLSRIPWFQCASCIAGTVELQTFSL